jgi:tartrate-resistant acid phosphatase type 5
MTRRFEPSVHLVDVTDDAALVAWGGFWLEERHGRPWVVDDDDLPPGGTIGAGSPPYGRARVDLRRNDGSVMSARADDVNHVWVTGLEPDTAYEYTITVDDKPWVPRAAPLRTHPAEDAPVDVAFAALGDYGVGVVNGDAGRRQAAVARTLTWLADHHDLRCVVGLGDNIYGGDEDRLEESGDEDDDWYFTFYEPYRHVIDRLPFYPAAGNHDGPDEEANDDRAQLEDNFHLRNRFAPHQESGRASLDPGLFYRLRLGELLELICVDTSWGAERGQHWFDDHNHLRWLGEALAAPGTPLADPVLAPPPVVCRTEPSGHAGADRADRAPVSQRRSAALTARTRAQPAARSGRRHRLRDFGRGRQARARTAIEVRGRGNAVVGGATALSARRGDRRPSHDHAVCRNGGRRCRAESRRSEGTGRCRRVRADRGRRPTERTG